MLCLMYAMKLPGTPAPTTPLATQHHPSITHHPAPTTHQSPPSINHLPLTTMHPVTGHPSLAKCMASSAAFLEAEVFC